MQSESPGPQAPPDAPALPPGGGADASDFARLEAKVDAQAEALKYLVETVAEVRSLVLALAPVLESFADSPIGRMLARKLKG